MSYLSSVFLSVGMTVATLARSGNLDEVKLLLIAVANGLIDNLMLALPVLLVFCSYQTPFWR